MGASLIPLGGRQSTVYSKKSLLGGAFEILAEEVAEEVADEVADEVAGGRRGDQDDPEVAVQQLDGDQQVEVGRGRRGDPDDPEEVVRQQDGDRQVGVLVLLVVPPSLVAPALGPVAPALLGEREDKRELVDGRTEPTGGIAPERTLGGTTGGSGQSRAPLG